MANPLRPALFGAVYHVTSRDNVRQNIVRDERDRRYFLVLSEDREILLDFIFRGVDSRFQNSLPIEALAFRRAESFAGYSFERLFGEPNHGVPPSSCKGVLLIPWGNYRHGSDPPANRCSSNETSLPGNGWGGYFVY